MKLAVLLPLLSLSPEKFLEGTVKRPWFHPQIGRTNPKTICFILMLKRHFISKYLLCYVLAIQQLEIKILLKCYCYSVEKRLQLNGFNYPGSFLLGKYPILYFHPRVTFLELFVNIPIADTAFRQSNFLIINIQKEPTQLLVVMESC